MARPLLIGAVAYDPKVVIIWEGIRDYLREHDAPADFALYGSNDWGKTLTLLHAVGGENLTDHKRKEYAVPTAGASATGSSFSTAASLWSWAGRAGPKDLRSCPNANVIRPEVSTWLPRTR